MGRIQKIQKIQKMKNFPFYRGIIAPLLLPIVISGCVTYKAVRPDQRTVALVTVEQEIPEAQLLDVRIQIFDPGTLPSSADVSRGLSEEIRKAEARYIPVQIRNALQRTGHWGAVRVVPAGASGDEVQVFGRILKSNGEELHLEIEAQDATGRKWFKKKVFKGVVDIKMYKNSNTNKLDVFQNLYNRIANELAAYRQKMSSRQVDQIRRTAELRFAEELAPSAFTGYLKKNGKNGRVKLDRLPPAEDEMLQRVRRIRERNYMLVDTLDAHYESLYKNMGDVYTEWRKSRLIEMNMIRQIDARKNAKLRLGTGVIVGAAVLGALLGKSRNTSNSAVTTAVIGTAAVATTAIFREAIKISEEAKINKAALEELGESFEADVEPTVLKIEGETIKLTGSAEAKYQQWRDVMKDLYEVETDGEKVNTEWNSNAQGSNEPVLRNIVEIK